MLLKPAVYETIMKESRKMVTPEIYGCDCCGKELIESDDKYPSKLTTSVYNRNDINKDFDYCSWECVLKHLPEVSKDCDEFIDLPFVYFNKEYKGENLQGINLIELIKNLK